MERKKPARLAHPLAEAGLSYSVAALLPVVLSFVALTIFRLAMGEAYADSNIYKYTAYLLPQLCFAVAALLCLRRSKLPVRSVYAPCKWYDFLLAILLAFGLFSLSWLNSFFVGLFERLGYTQPASPLPDVAGFYLLPAILVIAVLPAIFEETLFRGIQVTAMRRSGWGTATIVLLTGALFSLFHGNPEQTLYQFACGAAYALLAVRSGSVFPTMLAHFCNNAVILVMTACGLSDFPAAARPYIYAVAGMVLAFAAGYLIFFDKRNRQRGGAKEGGRFFVAAAVGIVVCAVEWIATLLGGFGL